MLGVLLREAPGPAGDALAIQLLVALGHLPRDGHPLREPRPGRLRRLELEDGPLVHLRRPPTRSPRPPRRARPRRRAPTGPGVPASRAPRAAGPPPAGARRTPRA